MVRLAVALVALAAVDVAVRVETPRIERQYLEGYRVADVRIPALDEYSAAVAAHRAAHPGRIAIGLAGPSTVHGYRLAASETIAVRLQARLRAAGFDDVDVYNLAMPKNRYSDDRMVAAYFAGLVDVVLIPYSSFQLVEQCEKHPDLLAWSNRIPTPFFEAPGCPEIHRHRVEPALGDLVGSVWATYRHRNALRRLVFPRTGDLGRAAFESVNGRLGHVPPIPVPTTADVPVPVDPPPTPPRADVAAEPAALCAAYAPRGTQVLFYRFPIWDVRQAADALPVESGMRGFEEIVDKVTATEPRCRHLQTDWKRPGPGSLIDGNHPSALGADQIADTLSQALPRVFQEIAPRRRPAAP